MIHYYDPMRPLNPYAYSLPGEIPEGAFLPDNAILAAPETRPGYWPVLNAKGNGWDYTEDHRKRTDERGREVEGSGTPYWLPGDTHRAPARYMTDLGPLPDGWSDTPPPAPPAEARLYVLSQLAALDAACLPPRTLADLAAGDEAAKAVALEKYQEHEVKAELWRERLAAIPEE